MNTVTIKIRPGGETFTAAEDAALRRGGSIIQNGGLVAFPTETVYGLGGDALNRDSSRKIYAAKGRPSDNPLIVHICKLEDMEKIAREVPEEAFRVAEAFWPGPLTMILHKAERVPTETTGGLDTVAVRFPSDKTARKLIEYGGGYIAAPSANRSGRPSPTLAKYVAQDLDGRIDMIIDGGRVGIGLESTILDMTVRPPQILRPGYVTEAMLHRVLREVDTDVTILEADSGQAPRAPGMKYRHYAPRGELTIVEGELEAVIEAINRQAAADRDLGEKTGIICASESERRYLADAVKCLGSRGDQESVAGNLFAALREFDDEGVTKIYAESFEAPGLGQAIMNRLLKAAGHRVIRV
ncbi:MAG: L-threonylcarbamoyladenylate synthase [Butyrivibrio sp.]|nr:L-threonylcarbamoyladenylate synthase [Acetatifactor muris]MCM1558228.1 L-threonylcarbamoyladenylate synthase [Butyrivibrio sp.]